MTGPRVEDLRTKVRPFESFKTLLSFYCCFLHTLEKMGLFIGWSGYKLRAHSTPSDWESVPEAHHSMTVHDSILRSA